MKNHFSRPLALVLPLIMTIGMLTNTVFAAGTTGKTVDETLDEIVDELADAQTDGTKSEGNQPTDTETTPVEEYVFNPGTTGSNFGIKEVGSTKVTYAKDTGYSAPMTLEAGKTYEFWSRWEYDSNATVDTAGVGFTFQSIITANTNMTRAFNAYVADYERDYNGEDAENIWYRAAEDLKINILTDTIKIWSDGELGDGLAPDPTSYRQANNYLWDIPIGYDALDGVFKPGQACYVSLQITTEATSPAATENNNSSGDTDASSEPATPPVDEPTEEYDPTLPRVFKGEIDSSSRELFTEENRPDYAVFNSVTNNPDYGDETKFLRITDLSTGEVYQEGVIELIPGRQYQVELFYRNDATFGTTYYGNKSSRDAKHTYLGVTMPYELAAGTTERFSATISADNTMPLAVSAGVDLVSRYGLYLEYADGSAVWQKNGSSKIEAVDYEKLFRDGVYLESIGSESYGTVSFTIRATSDGSTPVEELPAEVTPNSGTTRTLGDKIWEVFFPAIVASVLITLLAITVIIILLDILARLFHPPLREFPIIRHCAPMPEYAKAPKTENHDEAGEAPAEPAPAPAEEPSNDESAGDK